MRFRSLAAAGAAAIAVCASATAVPATAAPTTGPVTLKVQVDRIVVLEEHETANGGYVKFTTEKVTVPANSAAAADVQPKTITSVGGGTWDYGSALSGGQKACHSYYNHPSVSHGSTAKLGSSSNSKSAPAGSTSFAYLKGGLSKTCEAFWNK